MNPCMLAFSCRFGFQSVRKSVKMMSPTGEAGFPVLEMAALVFARSWFFIVIGNLGCFGKLGDMAD